MRLAYKNAKRKMHTQHSGMLKGWLTLSFAGYYPIGFLMDLNIISSGSKLKYLLVDLSKVQVISNSEAIFLR